MLDGYRRKINYLRISLTDRCNLRCIYCMPPEGVKTIEHEEILSLEEIYRVVKAATLTGIQKIRFTGGEPLVRLGMVDLIEKVSKIPEIDDISLTTNGMLLKKMGKDLKKAGLKRVNISLDSFHEDRFQDITRCGDLKTVLSSIEEVLNLGLHPVKINTVIIRHINYDEVVDFARWTLKLPINVRFIELMPIGICSSWAKESYVTAEEIKGKIYQELGTLHEELKLAGSGPAKYYRLAEAKGTIGFITAISDHFCNSCNRLRLTANGGLRPCLFDKREIDIKTALRSNATDEELALIISEAIRLKPDRHHLSGGWQDKRIMSQIGG